jgi:hypothetical protein
MSQPALLREHLLFQVAMQVGVEQQAQPLDLSRKTLIRATGQYLPKSPAVRIRAYHQVVL